MKQLSKIQSAIFLLGGVLMVVGAGCYAFGFIYPKMLLYTCWVFLVGTVLFSVIQAMQLYRRKIVCHSSSEAHTGNGGYLFYIVGHFYG